MMIPIEMEQEQKMASHFAKQRFQTAKQIHS
jgi:hypothetical protein